MFTPEDIRALVSDRPVAVRALAALWASITAVEVAIWLLIAVIGGHLDTPWPLFTAVPLGIVVAGAYWLTTPREPRSNGNELV
jgi:hypothetical protein